MTGKELQEWRRRMGLTQEGLAQQLGVIRLTVARWEIGTRAIPSFLPLALEALEIRMLKGGTKDGDNPQTN
jgi:transcriptional regulator with XRE-family HTH domain